MKTIDFLENIDENMPNVGTGMATLNMPKSNKARLECKVATGRLDEIVCRDCHV